MGNAVTIKSFVLITIAVLCAAFAFKKAFSEARAYLWVKWWLLPIGVACFTTNIWLIYLSVIFVCLKWIPKGIDQRLFAFILMLPALPDLLFPIPFPGVNYLFELTYPRMLVLCLLLPIYMEIRKKKHERYRALSYVDYLVAFFCIITTVLDCRLDTSVTFWARLAFYKVIDIWVPYFVISRAIRDFHSVWVALAFSGCVMAVLAVIEWRMTWKAYAIVAAQVDDIKVSWLLLRNQYRGIGLRISGSWLEPISFGFFMAITVFLAYRADLWKNRRSLYSWGLMAIACFALLLTDSRAGIIMLVICIAMVMYFGSASAGLKALMATLGVIVIVVLYFKAGGLVEGDENGTFQYRWDLIVNSADAVKANPLWGTPHFLSDPTLVETMTQGQGIVDIVNAYLGVLLQYGLSGLVPFLLLVFFCIKNVASTLRKNRFEGEVVDDGVLLLCLLGGASVLIFTTSVISLMPYYLWLLYALSAGYVTAAQRKKSPLFSV